MSGYDTGKNNLSFNLMAGRLRYNNNKNYGSMTVDYKHNINDEVLDGVNLQAMRLLSNGGFNQQDRMIFDKRRSLDRALNYSYQSAPIRKIQCDDNLDNSFLPNIEDLDIHEICRGLINPDKTKMNYDDKILSVHFEENFHAGDIFEWLGTNTYWLIYLQDMTELAYFRGEIRKCSYEIEWENNGKHKTFAAIRGPVETKIDYIQKHGISVDNPNHSLNILMPRTPETLEYFKRYAKFYLTGQDEGSPNLCWRVEATDWISTPGILEITAVEYYANELEDDIQNGIAGGLKVDPINPNTKQEEIMIKGPTFIKPNQICDYNYTGLAKSKWSIKDNKKIPVKFEVDPEDPLHIKLKWNSTYSGQFELSYGIVNKTIVVESLF